MEREGEEKKKGQATVETGGRERIASFARGGGQAKLESKMGRAAADGFEKGSRRDRARHYHFRALRYATDMKQPFLLALAAAALLHVVSASADHPSRHDQAARTLDRMGAGGHGLRAYVRGVICVCGPLERVVRCEPKSQTLTSNTCFRVRCTRPMKDGRCRQAALQAKRNDNHATYSLPPPSADISPVKSPYQRPGREPVWAEKLKNPPNAAACSLRTGFA